MLHSLALACCLCLVALRLPQTAATGTIAKTPSFPLLEDKLRGQPGLRGPPGSAYDNLPVLVSGLLAEGTQACVSDPSSPAVWGTPDCPDATCGGNFTEFQARVGLDTCEAASLGACAAAGATIIGCECLSFDAFVRPQPAWAVSIQIAIPAGGPGDICLCQSRNSRPLDPSGTTTNTLLLAVELCGSVVAAPPTPQAPANAAAAAGSASGAGASAPPPVASSGADPALADDLTALVRAAATGKATSGAAAALEARVAAAKASAGDGAGAGVARKAGGRQ